MQKIAKFSRDDFSFSLKTGYHSTVVSSVLNTTVQCSHLYQITLYSVLSTHLYWIPLYSVLSTHLYWIPLYNVLSTHLYWIPLYSVLTYTGYQCTVYSPILDTTVQCTQCSPVLDTTALSEYQKVWIDVQKSLFFRLHLKEKIPYESRRN